MNAIKRVLPMPLKNIARRVVDEVNRVRYKGLLRQTPFDLPTTGIYVSYVGIDVGKHNSSTKGGRVKLTILRELYPDSPSKFNFVYIVSSALPEFAAEFATWAKEHGAKVVLNQNGVAYPAWAGDKYKEINKPLARAMSIADYVIYQSEFCKISADKYLGKPSAPWEIIYNSVDTDIFTPDPEIRLDSNKIKLLSVGTHQSRDRVETAINTVEALKKRGSQFSLSFVGKMDWPGGEQMAREMVEQSGAKDNISFHPPFTQASAPSIYKSGHILLHSKYNDPCPTVVMEAMACGLPVVATRSGGTEEIVGNEGGELVDVKKSWQTTHTPDPKKMADAVERVAYSRQDFSRIARDMAVKSFGKREWLEKHSRLFESLSPGLNK